MYSLLFLFAVFGSTWALPPEFWAKKLGKLDIFRNMIIDFQKLHEDQQTLFVPGPANGKPVFPVLTWEDNKQSVPGWIPPHAPAINIWEASQPAVPTWIFPSVPAPAPAPAPTPLQPIPTLTVWPPAESFQFVPLDNKLLKDMMLFNDTKFQLPSLSALNIQKDFTKNIIIEHNPTTPSPATTSTICPPCPTTTTTTTTPVPTTSTTTEVPSTTTNRIPCPCSMPSHRKEGQVD